MTSASFQRRTAIGAERLGRALDCVTEAGEAARRVTGRMRRNPVQRALRDWAGHPAIRAFGLSLGRHDRRLVLSVYVEGQRRPGSWASPAVPAQVSLPGLRRPVRVELGILPSLRLQSGFVENFAAPEISIRRAEGGTGTAGCIVARPGSTDFFLLSCAHVMAWEGETDAAPMDPIYCPAVQKSGQSAPSAVEIGNLVEWSPALENPPADPKRVDAAYARLNDAGESMIPQIGVPRDYTDAVAPGDQIEFRGARSGPQRSKIKSLLSIYDNTFFNARGGPVQVRLRNLIVCDPCSHVGDSGSAVYLSGKPRTLIGLVIGGTEPDDQPASAASGTVVCRIQEVFNRFGLDLVGKVFGPSVAATFPEEPAPAAPVVVAQPAAGQPAVGQPAVGQPPIHPAPVPMPPAGLAALAIDKVTTELILKVFNNDSIEPQVEQHWPIIKQSMMANALTDAVMVSATLATVFAEDGAFDLVDEVPNLLNSSDPNDASKMYDRYETDPEIKKNLGNTEVGDGPRFHGRGFVQLTGRWNYKHFGDRIKVDLISNPAEANTQPNAADILAEFIVRRRGIISAALRKNPVDYETARRAINGGVNGLKAFKKAYDRCLELL